MNDINYSLIIPNRNIPNLLQRCLDSVPHRKDLQIIVVDDNSDPNVVDFNHYPGSDRDDVEVVFTKEGKGAGYARNVGLDKAKGKWLLFSDSDDTFVTNNLSSAMDKFVDSNSDIIFFNAERLNAETGERIKNNFIKEHFSTTISNEAAVEWFRYRSNVPWGKFIKRELVENNSIRFSEVIAGNDIMFSVKSGYYAEEVELSDVVIYNWIFRSNGNISRNRSKEAVLSRYSQTVLRNEFLRSKELDMWCGNVFRYLKEFKQVGFSRLYSLRQFYQDTPIKLVLPHFIEMIKQKRF